MTAATSPGIRKLENVDENGGDGNVNVYVGVGSQMSTADLIHVVKELMCYILFMHHQIPCMYSELKTEIKLLEDAETDLGKAERRRILREKKKLLKLQSSVDKLLMSIESAIIALYPNLGSILLLLGSNPLRPQEVYEVHFLCKCVGGSADNLDPSQQASNHLAKKVIRLLIATGAGGSAGGPKKLHVLIRAPSNSACPPDFLPRRSFFLERE